jgi:tetratricopeptide (TPR) repeat protein
MHSATLMMPRRRLRLILPGTAIWNLALVVLIAIASAAAAKSQSAPGNATLYGTVRDSGGKPIASATVRLQFTGEAKPVTVLTDKQGKYNFTLLRPGVYALIAETGGHSAAAFPSIFLGGNEAKNLDLTLDPIKSAPGLASSGAPEFYDPPQFTVSGVTDATSLGGHGSDSVVRTKESIARETASLGKASPPPAAPDSAEASLRERLEREPGSFAANHDLGRMLIEHGKERAAVPYLERAAALNSSDYENTFDLARAYANTGDYRDARAKSEPLLAQHDTAQLHHLLADIQEKSGNSLEAVSQYQRAAELEPSEPNFFDWGSELLLHRAPEPAVQVFTKGVRLFPRSTRMMIGLGAADFAGGSYDQAVDRICAASDLNPDDPTPYLFLGKLQRAESAPSDQLVERLHRFVTLHPDDAEANYFYAVVLWKQRKDSPLPRLIAQVESLLDQAVRLDPKFGAAYLQVGILYSEQEDFTKAVSAFQQAVEAAPDLEEAHYRLAQAYRETGQADKAKAELRLYQHLAQESAQNDERERREIRQFVYTLRDRPRTPGQ